MDTISESSIVENLATLAEKSTNDGIFVQFVKGSGLDPLKAILIEALREYRNKSTNAPLTNGEKKSQKVQEETKKAIDIVTKELKTEKGTLDDINKNQKESIKELNKKAEKDRKEWLNKANEVLRAVNAVKNIAKDIGGKVIDDAKRRIDWVSDLQESGVRLSSGFEESFHNLTQLSGRSHDDFIKLLTANSKMVTRFNAVGKDGAEQFAKMSRSVIGKWGVTGKEAETIMKNYMENLTMFDDNETLRRKDMGEEMMRTTKYLKGLSIATGKSIDQITEETKLKEKNFLHQRLATDSATKEQYAALKSAGYSDDMIESFLLGKANKESVLFQATAEGADVYRQISEAVRNTSGLNDGSFIRQYADVVNSESAQKMFSDAKNIDLREIMYARQDSDYMKVRTNALALDPLRTRFDKNAMDKQLSGKDKETEAIDKMMESQSKINKLQNEWVNKTTLSLSNAVSTIDKFNGALDKAQWGLEHLNDKFTYGLSTVVNAGTSVLTHLGGLLLVGKGVKGLTKLFTKGASKAVGKTAAKAATKAATKAVGKTVAKKAVTKVATKAATKAVGKTVAKSAGKGLLKSGVKKIPLIGALAGLVFGAGRALSGDWSGAGLELASGLASTVPGLGTAASIGIDAALAAKDIKEEMDKANGGPGESTPLVTGADELTGNKSTDSQSSTEEQTNESNSVEEIIADQREIQKKMLEELRTLTNRRTVTNLNVT